MDLQIYMPILYVRRMNQNKIDLTKSAAAWSCC